MQTVVNNLLNKIHAIPQQRGTRVRKSAADCLIEFHDYLTEIKNKHIKRNYIDDPRYIIDWAFDNNKVLKNDREKTTYCKIQICLAEHCFSKLIRVIANSKYGLTYHGVKKHKKLINDYLHDLRVIIEYLEQESDPNYCFFNGGKFYGTRTDEVFLTSNNLFWTSVINKNYIDHRFGQNLSVFSIRQCLELKFHRIIGVHNIFHETSFQAPKYRHDFMFCFIKDNMDLFEFRTDNIKEIWKIYKWTNLTVHMGILPRVWELQYALEIIRPLIVPLPLDDNGTWSSYSSVKVNDVTELQERFNNYFSNEFTDSAWKIEFMKPEAIS